MKLPDELETELKLYKEESESTIQTIAIRGTIASLPFVGSPIVEIFNGLAQRRAQERLNEVFGQVKNRLEELGEDKIDREFFRSEEFQSLLFLLLERLHATHQTEKLKMFGNALVNSGLIEFKTDDKEEFARVLRDLSLTDLTVLNDGNLKNWRPHIHEFVYGPDVLPSLFRLQGMGLVVAKLSDKQLSARHTGSQRQDDINMFTELLTKPPKMTFYLSPFGARFLQFISPDDLAHKNPPQPSPS